MLDCSIIDAQSHCPLERLTAQIKKANLQQDEIFLTNLKTEIPLSSILGRYPS